MVSRSPLFDLYLVSDRNQTQGRDLACVLQQALDGGAKAVQVREKDLGGRDLFILAEKIKLICQRYQAALFINDRIDIALAVDADGVQLGNASMPIEAARELLGKKKLIGASTHSLKEAEESEQKGADFILFGPVYFTPSKAVYGKPQGTAALKEVVEKISLPVYAIGGVKPKNIEEVRKTGIHGVALISAVLGADDPRKATEEILKLLQR